MLTLVSVNAAPTAAAGGPYVIAEGQSLTLDGSDSDDPDAGDILTFSWDVNGDGTFGDATGVNPTLSWVQLVALGLNDGLHVNDVRVRVDDGAGHVVDSPVTTLTINNAPPTVAVTGPASGLSFQAQSFTFTATDPSVPDQAGTFTYRIDWEGDGIVDEVVTGGGSVTLNHTFVEDDAYFITVTAADGEGAEGPATTHTFDIGDCDGAAGTAALDGDGNLIITGTTGDDRIRVRRGCLPNSVRVRMNRHTLGTFTLSPAAKIYICGLEGDDQIRVGECVTYGTIIRGDSGNDTVWAGGGDDALFGDAGCDKLYARHGADWLDGGLDNDRLYAGSGGDTLLGGDGNDILKGGQGCDWLDGGAGNDSIHGGARQRPHPRRRG